MIESLNSNGCRIDFKIGFPRCLELTKMGPLNLGLFDSSSLVAILPSLLFVCYCLFVVGCCLFVCSINWIDWFVDDYEEHSSQFWSFHYFALVH